MARIFKGVSIVIHAVVIATLSYVQLFNPGLPHSVEPALAYQMPVEIAEVPSPPAPKRPTAAPSTDRPDLAPIDQPRSLPDPGHEPAPIARQPGVEGGVGDLGGVAANLGHVQNIDEALPAPAPPPAGPQKPLPIGGNIRRPVRTFNVDPVYPELARAARKEGIVILEVVIATDGRVESVRVLRGVPTLDQAAITAVQQWRFEPARLNGQAVPVVMTVTVNFQLTK